MPKNPFEDPEFVQDVAEAYEQLGRLTARLNPHAVAYAALRYAAFCARIGGLSRKQFVLGAGLRHDEVEPDVAEQRAMTREQQIAQASRFGYVPKA